MIQQGQCTVFKLNLLKGVENFNTGTQKRCCTCKEEKPTDSFHKKARRCKVCAIDAARASYAKNKEAISIASKAPEHKAHKNGLRRKIYQNNPEKINDRNRTWKAANREKVASTILEWQRKNKDKVAINTKKWMQANKGMVNARTRRRQTAKLQRTPAWLGAVDHAEMDFTYAYCAALRSIGMDYHVDHTIPLQGKIVSGFHVPSNLQVIHASDNMKKNNKHMVQP